MPDGGNIVKNKYKIKLEKGAVQPLEHLNCFTRYSLIKLLQIEGFKKYLFLK